MSGDGDATKGLAWAFWLGIACWAAVALLAFLIFGCASATPAPPASVAMLTGQQVVPPNGFIDLCLRDEAECAGGTDSPVPVTLTPAKWSELDAVNDYVNRLPQLDDDANYGVADYWTLPNDRGGDCEDLALMKRSLLLARGWPVSALLLASAEQWNGEYHAALIVATDHGDYVLDNLNREIVAWRDAPYVWKKRQSRERPYLWVMLDKSKFMANPDVLPPLGAPVPFIEAAIKMRPKISTMEARRK